jgi:hypothetical protein
MVPGSSPSCSPIKLTQNSPPRYKLLTPLLDYQPLRSLQLLYAQKPLQPCQLVWRYLQRDQPHLNHSSRKGGNRLQVFLRFAIP